ncbi:MAG TPA: DUF2946 family protein [Gemmataceae bacterium]|nr:DUF2946 family protein [Gemmataceae bacterium]
MQSFLRGPLVSAVALATYLVVHVFAAVLHHHTAECGPGKPALAVHTEASSWTAGQVDDDHEDEACVLCTILSLAPMPAAPLSLTAITPVNEDALSPLALIRPYPLETATHSRGPPL